MNLIGKTGVTVSKLNDLVEMLELIDNPNERIEYLVSYAEKFKEVPPEIAERPFPEENKIPFCESGAYVWVKPRDDKKLNVYFAVENPQGISAMALSAILEKTINGETPEQMAAIPEDLVYKIFGQGLSMGKNMGLTGIVQYIKRQAKKYV